MDGLSVLQELEYWRRLIQVDVLSVFRHSYFWRPT